MTPLRVFATCILACGFLAGGMGACTSTPRSHPPTSTEVVVSPDHVHDAQCGHYYHGGRWYHASKHLHGAGCGHRSLGGIWVPED
ncbi:MAG: hypothetical protein HYY16_16615 [Planctomycetes bacterium]|nr:hypothetical protein [Planctomycetota bacterium]